MRKQIIIVTAALTALLLFTQLVSLEFRYWLVIFLSLVSYGMSAFALRKDLHGVEWFTLLATPTLFTTAVSMFYFLLPERWLTRLPVAFLYGVGMYALLLTENIYNVAVVRTIALLRAAHSVGFLLTLVTYFMLSQTILAFRFGPLSNACLFGVMTLFLALPTLWAMEFGEKISRRVWAISVSCMLVLIHFSWIISFFPFSGTMASLLLTTVFYGMVSMGQQYIAEKLYRKNIIELTTICFVVGLLIFITTVWH